MQVQKNDPSVVSNYFRPGTQLSVKTEGAKQKAAKVAAVIFTAIATIATGFLYLAFTAVAFKIHDNKLAKLANEASRPEVATVAAKPEETVTIPPYQTVHSHLFNEFTEDYNY